MDRQLIVVALLLWLFKKAFDRKRDILTAADFYTVGMRTNSYLSICDFIAEHIEYTIPLIDHLVKLKTGHLDISIREHTAKALKKFSHHNPEYMRKEVLPKLF